MPNAVSVLVEKLMPALNPAGFWGHLRREIVGLAQDYWKDGNWHMPEPAPFADLVARGAEGDEESVGAGRSPQAHAAGQSSDQLWHAEPGEISEKMWGAGYVTPIDEYIAELLMTPLGVTKDMNLLDLSAGLGGRLRKASAQYGIYITGYEPDPAIARRGMALSVASGAGKHVTVEAYNPENFKLARKYDCIISRETIYRVPDKQKFAQALVEGCKPKAQLSFTDYIVNAENRDQPGILAWQAFEQGAAPLALVEMAELWAKVGISIRVHDDQTDYYKKEIKAGLIRLAKFLATSKKPDEETKKAIARRIAIWAHRMAAMEQGMRFYRFYGLR